MRFISKFLFSLTILLVISCSNKRTDYNNEKFSWVYIEVLTVESSYECLYGEINSTLLKEIQSGKAKNKLFSIRDVRYRSMQDSFEVEKGVSSTGIYTFYTGNIRRVEELNLDPLLTTKDIPLSKKSEGIKNTIEKERLKK